MVNFTVQAVKKNLHENSRGDLKTLSIFFTIDPFFDGVVAETFHIHVAHLAALVNSFGCKKTQPQQS